MPPTLKEMRILKMSADLWNALVELEGNEPLHEQDLPAHMRDINSIQSRVMARTYLRIQNEKQKEETDDFQFDMDDPIVKGAPVYQETETEADYIPVHDHETGLFKWKLPKRKKQ